MDSSRILKKINAWKIPWKKIHGMTEKGQQYQEGLLVAAEYKGMENTSREWGFLGPNVEEAMV